MRWDCAHREIKIFFLSLLLMTSMFFISMQVRACSNVFWNTNNQAKVVARSFDLFTSDNPKMLVMPRGITRNGMVDKNSVTWTSKYGSVVINTFDSPTISDGMNEAGLSAHLLYLHDTQYEKRDSNRPAISNLIWAQYFIDNYKTVSEAVKDTGKFQVVATTLKGRTWPIHLVLEDKTGDSATIEYINQKMVIHHGHQFTVTTNEPSYDQQLNNLKRYKLFGGNLSMPGDIDSMSRFVRASSYLKTLPDPANYLQAIASIFSVIRTTMVPFGAADTSGGISVDTWPTRWITVSDLTNKIYYFSSTTAPNTIWVDLKSLNFSPHASQLILDVTSTKLGGDISKEFH
jgi:penicillin V acylase-like amidase (Ntn superfamily)